MRPRPISGSSCTRIRISFQTAKLPFGRAHVFFPEAREDRCTAAVLLEVDPVGLVRRSDGGSLRQYVNDRPYAASSLMSVALARLFSTALSGRSKERPELAATEIPLEAELAVIAARGGEGLLERLFVPLGYEVGATRLPLDETFPSWGESDYFRVLLWRNCRLSELLSHLYVLIPVLDDEKHYWVGDDEVEKLLRRGEEWLPAHPERELIVNRYLKRQRSLTQDALARLAEEDHLDPDADEARHAQREEAVEERIGLNRQRLAAVHIDAEAARSSSRPRPGLRRGAAAAPADGRPQLRGDRRDRRVAACSPDRIASTRARPAAAEPAGPSTSVPGLADLPRPSACGLRRGGGGGGDRAPRSLPPRGVRAGRLRTGEARCCGRYDAERGVQRALRDAARRRVPAC